MDHKSVGQYGSVMMVQCNNGNPFVAEIKRIVLWPRSAKGPAAKQYPAQLTTARQNICDGSAKVFAQSRSSDERREKYRYVALATALAIELDESVISARKKVGMRVSLN